MRRCSTHVRLLVAALLLAADVASAQSASLLELFKPGSNRHPLKTVGAKRFGALTRPQQLVARGLEPGTYRAAPAVEDRIDQWNNIRHRLFAGFGYEKRLARKGDAFLEWRDTLPASTWLRLLDRLDLRTPQDFAVRHRRLSATVPRGMMPNQPLQALRHSERQFYRWYAREFARRINEWTAQERGDLIYDLGERLTRGPVWRRVYAATVLGDVADPRSERVLEDAAPRNRDPAAIGAIMVARIRRGGPKVAELLARWAGHTRESVRRTALRLCERFKDRWVLALLESRRKKARGRERDQIERALARRTGRGPDYAAAPLAFYGIPTHSQRVLFLIDVSGSMALPLDGANGKRSIRIEKTQRELLRAFSEMPASVKFNLVLFAYEAEPWSRRLVAGTESNKQKALEFLKERKVVGGTNVYSALDFAMLTKADTIFMLTDGEPSVGTVVDPALILAEFSERDPYGYRAIHTIGLAQDQNAELLVNLAHRHDGQYVAVR